MSSGTGIIPFGFRGDPFLLYTVNNLVQQAGIPTFVETGAFYGTTVQHMARSYPQLTCFSCEPNTERFAGAREATVGLVNCTISQEESPALLRRLAVTPVAQTPTLFWLDAHGYGFDWPLREEISIITAHWPTAYILIDDMLVPGRPWLDFDEYAGQECSYRYIQDAIKPGRVPAVWYPNYPVHAVTDWPLRGWGLLVFDQRSVWQSDQWLVSDMLESGDGIPDRALQRGYWESVFQEVQKLCTTSPRDVERAWERLAQQMPQWLVPDVAQWMINGRHFPTTAWLVVVRRMASSTELALIFTLLNRMPPDLAVSMLPTLAGAWSPTIRTTAIHYLKQQPITPFQRQCLDALSAVGALVLP